MKKLPAIAVLAAVLLAAPPGHAITWTLVESSTVHLLWPNEGNSANSFEAAEGLLGRVVSHTSENALNVCELAESHPCASGEPPAALGSFDVAREGAPNSPSNKRAAECNRKVIACVSALIPGAHGGHPGSNTPNETPIGEFSYFVLHRASGARSLAFISGTYVTTQSAYQCNSCPPTGAGRDIANAVALTNPKSAAVTTTNSVSLWTTQFVDGGGGTGHAQMTLATSTAGALSACGNGLQFETLTMNACAETTDYPIPVKWKITTYSVSAAQHTDASNPERCDSPDCYVQQAIIPAALSQSADAKSVQVREASAVLPAASPFNMGSATLDIILFAFTTQLIDADGDMIEDRVDPCLADATNTCVQNLFGSGACPAGQIFCSDSFGTLACRDPFLCDSRLDANQDCVVEGSDFGRVAGQDDGSLNGLEIFNTGAPVGPFDP